MSVIEILNFERYNQMKHNFKFHNNVFIFTTTSAILLIEPVFKYSEYKNIFAM